MKNPFEGQPKWLSEGRDRTRELVRVRDNHKCQSCRRKWKLGERRFDIHHLRGMCGKKSRGYDRARDLKKLITFCHSCHMKKHAKNTGRKDVLKIDEVLAFRKEGLSFDAIGRIKGVSQNAVWSYLHKHKVDSELDMKL